LSTPSVILFLQQEDDLAEPSDSGDVPPPKHLVEYLTAPSVILFLQQEDDLAEPSDAGAVPPPKQLTLERQLNKSILIGMHLQYCNGEHF
jgi:hypothetical protein